MIRIIAFGKKHEMWVSEGITRYSKRLRAPYDIEWVLVPHSSREGSRARQEESEILLSRIRPTDTVILLDERGKNLSSPELAAKLQTYLSHNSVTIIIGGAYGVNSVLQERADFIWSLSRLVLPHMLVRLLLTEQLYRSQEIAKGGPYHHE